MIIDGDGDVGIGTISPSAKLHIHSDGSHDEGAEIVLRHDNNNSTDVVSTISFQNNVGQVAMIQGETVSANNNGVISFHTDDAGTSTEAMRIDSSQRVGIGTNHPQGESLHVNGGAIISGTLFVKNDQIWYDANSTDVIAKLHDSNDDGIFSIYQNNTVVNRIHGNGASYFKGGSVGIGTDNPQDDLNIHDNSSSANLGIKITRGSQTHGLRIGVNDSHAFVWTDQAQSLALATNNTERLTILSNGNVGIGTTNPDGKLHIHTASAGSVTADSSSDDLVVENNNHGGISLLVPNDKASVITFGTPGDSIGAKIQWDNTNDAFDISTANNDAFIRFKTHNQTEAMRIDSSQNVGIGTAVPSGRLHVENSNTGIIVANDQITGNAFEVFGAQGNLLTVTDDLSDSLFSVNDAAGMPVFEVFADDTIKSYRNNESKLEINPDNNQIRLRDNAFVSGAATISGNAIVGGLHFNSLSSHFIKNDSNLLRLAGDDGIKFQSYDGGWQTRMTIRDDGNVGMGTSNPQAMLQVNGDASITGSLSIGYLLKVTEKIEHIGDSNTSIDFFNDYIRLQAGGHDMLHVSKASNEIVLNESSASIDIRMESNSKTNMFFLDGSEDRIGIGTTQPATEFEVHGVISGVCNSNYYARFEHRDTDGGNQGSNSLGYNTRTVNTTTVNHGGFASLPGSNEIRLAAGEYYTNIEVVSSMGESFTELTDGSTTVTTADGTTLQSTK
jgi:hypothetical protein